MKPGTRGAGRPLRVLFVDTVIGRAGGQYALLEILKFLDPSCVVPLVASPRQSDLRTICEAMGITWVSLPFSSAHLSQGRRRPWFSPIRSFFEASYGCAYLAAQARKRGVDIIHANTFKAALAGSVASLVASKPLVFHDRTLFGHMPLGLAVAAIAKRVIVISDAVRAKYRGLFSGKTRLVPDSVDIERFAPTKSSPGDGKTVGYLGRISREKGIIDLVRAAPLVLDRIPGTEFVIAGSPFTEDGARYLGELVDEISRLGLSQSFRFAGYVDDARSFLGGITVLAVPSEKEGLGRVLLEAMALAKPVVAFDCGGPREVISSGSEGLLVRSGDLGGLADAIASLLADPELAARMGRAGRQTVVDRFSSGVLTGAICAVYCEICPGGK